MPIVIDEVVISINVDNKGGKGTPAGHGGTGDGGGEASKQQIVEECVERVMDILQQRDEP